MSAISLSADRLNVKAMLEGGVHRMSHVFRYSSLPTLRKENVAEHTFYVCLYCYLIAQDLVQNSYRPVPVNLGFLLSSALLHDIDESHTGDFLRTVKYGHPALKSALDEVSDSLVRSMCDELRVDFKDTWKCAKDESLEGFILEIADLARVVSYVLEEMQLGNTYLERVLPEVRGYFETLQTGRDLPFVLRPYVADIIEVINEHIKVTEARP